MDFTSNAPPTARCSLCGGNLHFNTALWMYVRKAGQQIYTTFLPLSPQQFLLRNTGFSRIMQVNSYTYIPLHFLIWGLFTQLAVWLGCNF